MSVDSGILATVIYREGDSLWNLAKKYYGDPLLWPRIADANGITDATGIPPGTPIHIQARDAKQIGARIADTSKISDKAPLPVSPPAHIQVKDPKRTSEKLVEEAGFEVIAVIFYQKDDTLRDLAEKYYGNPKLWSHIADANEISDETMLSVGTPIYIPAKTPEIPATEPKTPIKEPVQVIEKPTTEKIKPEKTKIRPPVRKKVEPRIADRIVSPFEIYKIVGANNLFRPLGWQERKPTKPPFVLTGIMGTEEKRKALVVDKKQRNSYYVSKGDSVGKAETIDILEDHVVLFHEGKEIKIGFGRRFSDSPRESSRMGRQEAGSLSDNGIEADWEELDEPVDHWREMDKSTRQMFYDYVRERGVRLGKVFRLGYLRERMLDEFYAEVMKAEGR